MENQSVNLIEYVLRAQNGDVSSYEMIVKRLQASAFSQAFSMLGDSNLAEDATQEAFVEAYKKLVTLRTPEAFITWFRRIVFTACSRIRRQISVVATSLEDAETVADVGESPSERAERKEREQTVHLTIQKLPDSLRMVTALYYIGGIGQCGIATYLGLSETTVKKRLFDARKKLKEGIANMAKTISDGKTPAEEVSARVIAELVGRPQPLLIKEHPIRQIVEMIKIALSDYELIDSSEVEEKEIYSSIQESYVSISTAYQLDAKHVLRTQTAGATLRAIKGRQTPIRLLTAGRVFRPEKEDEQHLKVFHQLDGICVAPNASRDELKETITKLITAALGPVEIRFRDADYGFVSQGMDVDVRKNNKWVEVAGCGILKVEMLREAGHNPEQVQGYAFGLGLERLAMLKLGLKSVLDLWRAPYVWPLP
jgi:RNA polymerase sigma factor (sigma-70 family)